MRDSARSNYSDHSPAPSAAGSHSGSQNITHSRSASKTSLESGSSGQGHRRRADHRGEGDQKRPPRTPTRAPTTTAGTPGGEGSRPSSRRRRPSGEGGGGGGSGGGSGGHGGRRRRAQSGSTPPSSDPRRHSHGHAKSRRTATTSSPRAGAAGPQLGAAGPSGVAPEPSPTPELDMHLVLSATWLEEGEGDAPGSELGASQLAARMAMLKARRTGVAVELREHVRAKQGIMGREPSAEECRADEWWAAMRSEEERAAKALGAAQRLLEAAQRRERAATEAARGESAAARRKRELHDAAAATAAERAARAEREGLEAELIELMALGDQVVAETGSLLPGMQGGGLAVGRPIGGGDAETQKQMLLLMQGMQSQLQGLQQSQEQMASENKRLGRPRSGGGGGADDDDDDDDQKTLAAYKRAREKVTGYLNAGKPPTVEAYAERDLYLFRLSDEDIRAEYEAYTRLYLDDATAAPVRGGAAFDPRPSRPSRARTAPALHVSPHCRGR